jgi:hypothetical protein
MTLTSSCKKISEPVYYHREYKNDLGEKNQGPSWRQQCQRVATVALPFFSLSKPLSLPISLGMGGLRTFSCASQLLSSIQQGNGKDIPYQLLQTTIAVVALGGTIFAHPAGMLITTGHDLIIETVGLLGHLKNGEHQKCLESCANIINNALYLALFSHGGLELTIASFAMQVMIGLSQSYGEFRTGNYLEATGHLLMSMARGNQLAGHIKTFQLRSNFLQNVKTCLGKEGIVQKSISQVNEAVPHAGTSKVYETRNASTFTGPNGYNFHIADYNDGTRIITCLDGPMRGYQGIVFNGYQVAESFDVKWHSNYFVHQYPAGQVTSYSNRQIAKLNVSPARLSLSGINSLNSCNDPNCAYERRDPRSGTIMHFDRYGNLLGRTKG